MLQKPLIAEVIDDCVLYWQSASTVSASRPAIAEMVKYEERDLIFLIDYKSRAMELQVLLKKEHLL